MPRALGARFALEAGFLILLAVALGFADLSPALIVVIMGLAWVLVSLIEYFAWRQGPRFPARFATVTEPAGRVEDDVLPAPEPEPPPRPPAPAAEEQTAVEPPSEASAQPESDAEEEGLRFGAEERARYSLEPLQPRPRRRWIVFGPRDRPGEESGSREEGS